MNSTSVARVSPAWIVSRPIVGRVVCVISCVRCVRCVVARVLAWGGVGYWEIARGWEVLDFGEC